MKKLLFWPSPLSGAIAGFSLYFTAVSLLLPLLLYLKLIGFGLGIQSSRQLLPAQSGMLGLLLLSLYGTFLCGIFYYRLLRQRFPGLPEILAKTASFFGAVFFPLAPWLILLPCIVRQRRRAGCLPVLTAGLLPVVLFMVVLADWAPFGHYGLAALLWGTGLAFLPAFRAAAPEETLQKRTWIILLLMLLVAAGLEGYGMRLDCRISRLTGALEKSYGMELNSEAFWQREQAGLPATAEPWATLLNREKQLPGLESDLPDYLLPDEEQIREFETSCRKWAEAAAAADALTDLPLQQIAHPPTASIFEIELKELAVLRSLARYYSLKLRIAARRSDLPAVADLARRSECLMNLTGSTFLLNGLVAIGLNAIRQNALAPAIPLLPEDELLRLAENFQLNARNQQYRIRQSVTGEIISAQEVMTSYFSPHYLVSFFGTYNGRREAEVPRLLPALFRSNALLYLWSRLDLEQTLQYFQAARQIVTNETLSSLEKLRQLPAEHRLGSNFRFAYLTRPNLEAAEFRGYLAIDAATAGVLAIAAERYRRKYGELPESLEQLVPEFYPEIPLDRTHRLPFFYESGEIHLHTGKKILAASGYRIYIANADGSDPGGAKARYHYTVVLSEPWEVTDEVVESIQP